MDGRINGLYHIWEEYYEHVRAVREREDEQAQKFKKLLDIVRQQRDELSGYKEQLERQERSLANLNIRHQRTLEIIEKLRQSKLILFSILL